MQLDLLQLSMYFAIGIGAAVSLLLIFVVWKFRERPGQKNNPEQIHGSTKLEIAWTLIPIVILTILAVPTVKTAFGTYVAPADVDMTVKATGNQWWFAFEYPGEKITTANEMVIPVGKKIKLEIESKDVIHSFWIPKLAGKTDMIPNRTNEMWIQADEAGMYYGQCAEYCGTQHAKMRFRVKAVSEAEWQQWVKDRQAGAKAPTDPLAVKGKEILEKQACIGCHTIDGTAAKGTVGPNLSNIGSRPTIAAGIIDNTTENLKAWVKNSQTIKPGNKMPAFTSLKDEDLDAIVAYLQSLK